MRNLLFLSLGMFFGILMFKSEAASWFRIYEMFHFHSFHMFGLMGSALATGLVLVQVIKRTKMKDINRIPIHLPAKDKSFTRYAVGGIVFGLGWALAGVCPGPMFVLAGAGYLPMLLVLISAVVGTWLYGMVKDKLPH